MNSQCLQRPGRRGAAAAACLLALVGALFIARPSPDAAEPAKKPKRASIPSPGCVECHAGIEPNHPPSATVSCVDCHGGDGTAKDKKLAHVAPPNPSRMANRKDRVNTYAAINSLPPGFIRFINPSDLRVADVSCGPCHEEIVNAVRRSIMGHNAMVHNAVFYNNGAIAKKTPPYGEAFTPDGKPAMLFPLKTPTDKEKAQGALTHLVPHPEWKATLATDQFRIFDRGNNLAGQRGRGTDAKIAGVFLNVLKTRLNDPTLWFMGPNGIGGDFRGGGCAACHMVYANDADPANSAQYARYGNRGLSHSKDEQIPKDIPGYPIQHKMTRSIPSSQCVTCHHHQGNGAIGSYQGSLWWDRETEAENLRKAGMQEGGPEQRRLPSLNPNLGEIQFADAHGHGWNFRRVYWRDRRGRILDKDGKPLADNDPKKWEKAVHLKDIHLEKGMQCVDCHFSDDVHGTGAIYGQMTDYITITCVDCHGTLDKTAQERGLRLSGPGAAGRDITLRGKNTPFGKARFLWRRGQLRQRSMMDGDKEWIVPQVKYSLTSGRKEYNPRAANAKLMQRDGTAAQKLPASSALLAHSPDKMECYACHSSWNTGCYGCHLPTDVNVASRDLHYRDERTRAYAPYNRQVVRSDLFTLGIGTTNKGNKITPARSASAVIVSVLDRNRDRLVHQQPTISAAGFTGFALTPNIPHTVRGRESKGCVDCHVSAKNDNNAWMASLLGLGTNGVNFVGKYVYLAEQDRGVRAVQVTEGEEPQPVIGSNFHRILHPESHAAFLAGDRVLASSHTRGTRAPRAVAVQGEFLFVADGPGGLRVLDIAAIDNQSARLKIVEKAAGLLSQDTRLPMKNAVHIVLPSSAPVSLARNRWMRENRPENREQPLHEIFRYALVADEEEGLVLVDIQTFTDGDPTNNRLRRAVTFNPENALSGARQITLAGVHAYVLTAEKGVAVVDLSEPLKPRLVAQVGGGVIRGGRAITHQFRYAFVLDSQGLKVMDITHPARPRLDPRTRIPLPDARGGIVTMRTYALAAAGRQGLAIIDVGNPAEPRLVQIFSGKGQLTDVNGVTVGTVNASTFAFVADGKNGLRVVRLIEPPDTPGHLGFAPRLTPELIATFPAMGPALAVADGMKRDRYVDEAGNQISVSNRLGSRPLSRKEMDRIIFDSRGELFRVTEGGKVVK